MSALKFFYNGIKAPEHKFVLQTCWYNDGKLTNYPDGTITIYAREYCYGAYPHRWVGFSKEIKDVFAVQNDTDIQSDYHDKDTIRVTPDHPLYAEVLEAFEKARQRHRGKGRK